MTAYVGFLVGGGVHLAVEAERVRAVTRSAGLIAVPFARRCVAGVIVKQGRLVPVFDLSLVAPMWNEAPSGRGDQIIVVSAGEVEAGFLARGAETFASDPGEGGQEPPRPPAAVREAILSGARRARGSDYGILRVEAALAAAGVPVA